MYIVQKVMVSRDRDGSCECKCNIILSAGDCRIPHQSPIIMSFRKQPVNHIILFPKLLLSNLHTSANLNPIYKTSTR